MIRCVLFALTLFSICTFAGENNVSGTVTAITGDEYGIYLRLDSGKPAVCERAPDDTIAVKPNYVGAFQVAAAALDRKVQIEADYVPFQQECVAKVITLTNGKVNGPQRR